MFKSVLTDFAKFESMFDKSASKNMIAPYMTINGMLEKKRSLSSFSDIKNLV